MNEGDLCPFCMRPECPGVAGACPRRSAEVSDLMTAQTLADVRVFSDGRGPWIGLDGSPVVVAPCRFCVGDGGYGVACHGCGRIGGWVRS